jgi:hypothetical protein
LQPFAAHGLQPFAAHGLHAANFASRGTTHRLLRVCDPAPQGLHGFAAQGLHPLAAQGLHPFAAQGLHPFFAAQGLQPFFAAQGLQPFFAAQGLQPFFAAQGFLAAQGLHPFFAACACPTQIFGMVATPATPRPTNMAIGITVEDSILALSGFIVSLPKFFPTRVVCGLNNQCTTL